MVGDFLMVQEQNGGVDDDSTTTSYIQPLTIADLK